MNAYTRHCLVQTFSKVVNFLVIVSMIAGMVLPPVSHAAPRPRHEAAGLEQFQPEAIREPEAETTDQVAGSPDVIPHAENTQLARMQAITDIYLPIIVNDGSGDTPPPPPEGVEVLVEPGVGGIAAAEDGSVRAMFSRASVQQDTWVRYAPADRPVIEEPGLAVGGPAFTLTAWQDASGNPVTEFPYEVTVITDTNPWHSVFTPSIELSVTYTPADVWGLDLSMLALYQKDEATGHWLKIPTVVYQDEYRMVANVDTVGEFVPMSRLAIHAPPFASHSELQTTDHHTKTYKLAIDPDDDVGHATWPGYGYQREVVYNVRLAQEVKARLENDKCRVDILLTRETDNVSWLDRSIRARMAQDFGAEVFVTFAFNACGDACAANPFWGSSGDGGSLVWSGGDADDIALGNELLNKIAVLGRPHKWGHSHPVLPYNEFVALHATYAHIETLYLDHNYDWNIIRDGFGSIADATYSAVRSYLESKDMHCGDDPNNPPPYPAPPSAELLKRWQDLGYQSMQTYGTGYETLRLRRMYQAYGGDPASMSTGNHIQQVNLARIPGRGGLDVDLTLFYNSQDQRNDLLGYGWSFPYNIRAQQYSDDSVSIVLHDGRTYHYTWNGSGYDTPPGVYQPLTATANGWEWTTTDGAVLTFEEVIGSQGSGLGVMTQWRDRRGNALSFEYDLSQQNNWQAGNDVPRPPLTKIIDTAGREFTLSYNGDSHITGLALPDGRTFSFGYDGDGNLTGITDARSHTRRFQYDARHRVTREWDPEDILFLQNVYDDRDRVIEQVDAGGTHSYFSYDPIGRVTTFTDNLGNPTQYYYDDQNRVIAIEDAQGHISYYEYDDFLPVEITDARGNETLYECDERGNRTRRTDPVDGSSADYYTTDVTTWEYNANNDLIKTTDALGNVTTFDYDGQGNLTAIHQPGSRDTTLTYNAWGQPLTMTDPNGHTSTYGYDSYGNLTNTTDAEGNVTASAYDLTGRETSYTDANGHTVYFMALWEFPWVPQDIVV